MRGRLIALGIVVTTGTATASVAPHPAPEDRTRALNALGAMARAAIVAYEREQEGDPPHRFCKSAPPVPAEVPKGTTYKPVDADWGGDVDTGWNCLKFAGYRPIRCQHSYIAGGPYKSAKRGNADVPEPDGDKRPTGYEVTVECDFDGDGKTSLYARTGAVRHGRLESSLSVFIADDGE
jgi:hypothetical protein